MRRTPLMITLLWQLSPLALAWADPARSAVSSSVVHDADRHTWTMANGTVQWQVYADPGTRNAGLVQVRFGSNHTWTIANGSDGVLTLDDRAREIGRQRDGFTVDNVVSTAVANGVRLDVFMQLIGVGVIVTRHYALYDESPTLELWTTVSSVETRPHVLSDLNAFIVTVPAGTAHWINGLQGDAADVAHDEAFTLQSRTLHEGEPLALGSKRRSSEQSLPWMTVDSDSSTFFAGVMWSGAWTMTATRVGSAVRLEGSLGAMRTTLVVGTPVEGPHAFVGAIGGGTAGVSRAVERFIVNGLRAGRPLTPLVTYNTWFAYGATIDESSMRAEMDRAVALGTELFVIDAGWYVGAGAGGSSDFESGLGTWEADPARFSAGLRALSDYAHNLGIRFGIWVEPERADRSTLSGAGLQEAWLATVGGDYQSAHTAQICLAGRAARDWLFDRLTSLIDDVQPDYLKWDNNFSVNCDRDGHGHGPLDGNFAHTHGLYDLFERLRDRYPSLLIENVSGGGNRLDLGMTRYSDVAWMDDRTAPSLRVRHNLEGLSLVFPPAYLLSFVVEHGGESLHQAADLSLYMRSRMEGVLGLCFRAADFTDGEIAEIGRDVATYKGFRDALVSGSAALLTPQAVATDGPGWDALQIRGENGESIVIAAFQTDPGRSRVTITPYDLNPTTMYDVRSLDLGPIVSATGADLMRDGIDLLAAPASAAHILLLTPQ